MIKISRTSTYYESTYLYNHNNDHDSNYGATIKVIPKETYSSTIRHTIYQWRKYYLFDQKL